VFQLIGCKYLTQISANIAAVKQQVQIIGASVCELIPLGPSINWPYDTGIMHVAGIHAGVRVEQIDGKDELVVTALEKLEEPAILIRLREAVNPACPEWICQKFCSRSPPERISHRSLRTLASGNRASPLVFDHINLLRRYAFSVPESVVRGELRPLRDPGEAIEDVA
jgi:hypothetical protein